MIGLEITRRCNLRCLHCNVGGTPQKNIIETDKELSLDEIKALIDSVKVMGTKYIGISGGEPFLRKDIYDVIAYIKEKELGLHISSNGICITDKDARRINELGLDAISISLDSVTPQLHDKIRGVNGAFSKTVKAIENLQFYNDGRMRVGISSIMTDLNIGELPSIVDFAKSLGVDAIRFQPCHIPLAYNGMDKEGMLSIGKDRLEDLDNIIESIIEKTQKNKIYTNSHIYLRGIKKYYKNPHAIDVECFAGYISCGISSIGNVIPCAFMPNIGNIRDETFSKIWTSQKFNTVRKDIKKGNCPKCWMGCYIEPSLRGSLKFALCNPFKYANDLRFGLRSI